MLQVRCPNCQLILNVADQHAGRAVRCSACQQVLTVPAVEPPIQTSAAATIPQPSQAQAKLPNRERPLERKPRKRRLWQWAVALLLLPLLFTFISPRNWSLSAKLADCPSAKTVDATAYYVWLSPSQVVLDLGDDHATGTRRIDVTHLLIQFLGELDSTTVTRVYLAHNGRRVFYIDLSDGRDLAESYENGGILWALNNCPSRVRLPNGRRPYEEWTGGWLGVMQKQAEDQISFVDAWTDG